MKQKHITIREDQEVWIMTNHLNLSRFVQAKLDELMAMVRETRELAEDGESS